MYTPSNFQVKMYLLFVKKIDHNYNYLEIRK